MKAVAAVRRWIAGRFHQFAWWLDRQADKIWNADEIVQLYVTEDDIADHPSPRLTAQHIYQAVQELP